MSQFKRIRLKGKTERKTVRLKKLPLKRKTSDRKWKTKNYRKIPRKTTTCCKEVKKRTDQRHCQICRLWLARSCRLSHEPEETNYMEIMEAAKRKLTPVGSGMLPISFNKPRPTFAMPITLLILNKILLYILLSDVTYLVNNNAAYSRPQRLRVWNCARNHTWSLSCTCAEELWVEIVILWAIPRNHACL